MLLIANGKVLTRDRNNPYLADGAVLVDREEILEVGERRELCARYPDAEFVDARGGVIMPGLINVHAHCYSGLARGLAIRGNNPHNFLEILEGTWWNIDRHLTLEGTKASAAATMLDCIRSGVTAIFDHHASFCQVPGSLFAIRDAAEELENSRNAGFAFLNESGRFLLRWEGACREGSAESADFPKEIAAVMTAVRDRYPWLLYR